MDRNAQVGNLVIGKVCTWRDNQDYLKFAKKLVKLHIKRQKNNCNSSEHITSWQNFFTFVPVSFWRREWSLKNPNKIYRLRYYLYFIVFFIKMIISNSNTNMKQSCVVFMVAESVEGMLRRKIGVPVLSCFHVPGQIELTGCCVLLFHLPFPNFFSYISCIVSFQRIFMPSPRFPLVFTPCPVH